MLNNTKVKRLKAADKTYRELDYDGLYIEVKPNGKKFWRYRYKKPDGKESMKSLGEFPKVDIDQARESRDAFRKGEEYSSQKDNLVSEVALKWLEWKGYKSQKNYDLIRSRIENYINPVIGNMPINHVKPKDILPILKRIEKRGHLELARRIQQLLSGIFKYGALNLLCETNPALILSGATKAPNVKHHPAITTEEPFKDLLQKVDAGEFMRVPAIKLALQLQAYIFLRSESMRLIKPGDVDLKNRLLSIPKTKNHREMIVPLCDSAIQIIEDALEMTDGFYLFSGMSVGSMISENSLNKRLRYYGIDKDEHVFHGYRTTFSTLARDKLRLEGELIEIQLDHNVKSKVQAAYDRSERLEERYEMMVKWGDYVDSLRFIK